MHVMWWMPSSCTGPPRWSADDARVVAAPVHGGEDVAGVVAALRLEHELDRGLADVEIEPLAQVLDVDEIGARLPDEREQACERAGAIGHSRQEDEAPALEALVAARDRGEQAGVDVAAAEHDDGRPRRRRRHLPAEQRRDADGAG